MKGIYFTRCLLVLMVVLLAVAVSFVYGPSRANAATAKAPLLQLPWPTGIQHDINGGYTYGCGDHQQPRDYYAIDFALPLNSKVSTVAAGTAHVIPDNGNGYGNYIWISHANSFISLYAHLNTFKVTDGQAVKQGQLIALSGNTGHSTDPHLHFSLRSNATSDSDGSSYPPEPMSGYTGFGQYGVNLPNCNTSNPNPSPMYTSSVPSHAWKVISPSPGQGLNGVAAVSSSDIWAVGGFGSTLIEHWNGSSWSVVSSPSPGTGVNILYGVAAVSTNNVWAVGYFQNTGQNPRQTLIEHWDGISWTVVASPNAALDNNLQGIVALSASNIWAVGFGNHMALIEHWDGTSWSIVPSPSISGSLESFLNGVTALSASNIWAVGWNQNSTFQTVTLIEHWDGTSWSVVSSPDGSGDNVLNGVASTFTKNVWAVGYHGNPTQTLIEHWNGTSWSLVSSPNPGTGGNQLNGVTAISGNNILTVGYYNNTGVGAFAQTLIENWNGTSWSLVSSPSPGSTSNDLLGIAATAANSVAQLDVIWAVGSFASPQGQTLTEFRD